VTGWPRSSCQFPAWLSRRSWLELDGQTVFTVDDAGHVIRAGVRPEVTSRRRRRRSVAVVKSLRCLRVVVDRRQSSRRSSSVFVALAFVSHVWCVRSNAQFTLPDRHDKTVLLSVSRQTV